MKGNHYELSNFSSFIKQDENLSTNINFKQLKEGISALDVIFKYTE